MHAFRHSLSLLLIAMAVVLGGCATTAEQKPTKTVYHFNEGLEQASNGLRNIRNHLDADPTAQIAVVTHSNGIDFLLEGARDKNGNPYDAIVDDLVAKGVVFKVCNNTLVARKIDKKRVIAGASIVPSGVAEIARMQSQEGYVYLKP